MKSFKKYLAESVRTYKYKIKIAGEPSKNFVTLFCHNLSKFDPTKISEPKSTPIQKEPYGFPGLKDQSVTIIDVEFKYPCTEPMIKQMAQLLGHDENMIRMIQSTFDDSINHETELFANQTKHSPLLTHSDLEDDGKQAGEDYADSYLGKIKEQEYGKKIKNEYSAKETKSSYDPFDKKLVEKSIGTQSPMTTTKRPDRPATGATAKKK